MSKQAGDVSEEVSLPRNFTMENDGRCLRIAYSWRVGSAVGATIGALLFNGMWISNGFADLVLGERELLLRLFALLFIVLGIGTTYAAIAAWLNVTRVSVDDSEVVVEVGPVPWWGGKRVTTESIEQLYVQRKYRGSRNNVRRYSYNVLAVGPADKPIKILGGLDRRDDALFFEQALERHLGIEDMVVADEMSPLPSS